MRLSVSRSLLFEYHGSYVTLQIAFIFHRVIISHNSKIFYTIPNFFFLPINSCYLLLASSYRSNLNLSHMSTPVAAQRGVSYVFLLTVTLYSDKTRQEYDLNEAVLLVLHVIQGRNCLQNHLGQVLDLHLRYILRTDGTDSYFPGYADRYSSPLSIFWAIYFSRHYSIMFPASMRNSIISANGLKCDTGKISKLVHLASQRALQKFQKGCYNNFSASKWHILNRNQHHP